MIVAACICSLYFIFCIQIITKIKQMESLCNDVEFKLHKLENKIDKGDNDVRV